MKPKKKAIYIKYTELIVDKNGETAFKVPSNALSNEIKWDTHRSTCSGNTPGLLSFASRLLLTWAKCGRVGISAGVLRWLLWLHLSKPLTGS